MIYINFVELLSLMHHAMFQNHRPSGSGEEKIYSFFPIYSHFSIHWSCDLDHLYKLSFPLPKDAPHEVCLIGQVVSEKKIVEYYGNIHVYCPGVGADQHLVSNFSFRIIKL